MKSRILIPRRNIIEFLHPFDERGSAFVVLDNGMTTDVYIDDRNNYRSITNNDHIIKHLNYYGLEVFNDKVILKEIMLNQDDEYCKIRFDIEVLLTGDHYKVELLFNEEENFSLNKFLIIDYFKLSLETLKEIDKAINYFLLEIVGITNTSFVVVTNERELIAKLEAMGYENRQGFIDAYNNSNIGEYILQKELNYRNN